MVAQQVIISYGPTALHRPDSMKSLDEGPQLTNRQNWGQNSDWGEKERGRAENIWICVFEAKKGQNAVMAFINFMDLLNL